MSRSLLFFFLPLFCICSVQAQNTNSDLAVKREEETDPAPFIAKIILETPDTNQVNLLCKIAHIYWHKRTSENYAVDSTLLYARQAYQMSKGLHFTNGKNEAAFMICKGLLEKKNVDLAIKLSDEVYGEEKVRLLLSIAESYVFHFPSDNKELAKALPLIEKAKKVSEQTQSLRWSNECSNLLAKLRFNQGDIAGGKRVLMDVINLYHQLKDYDNEAQYWSKLGSYMPETNNTYADIIHSQEMAVHYYLLANNMKEAGYALRDLSTTRTYHNQFVQAERDLNQMLKIFASIHEQLTPNTLKILSEFYRFTGKY